MTVQVKDSCTYFGCEYQMSVCLGFPVDGSRVKELTNSELAESDSSGLYSSTACWRNYVASWEVRDELLYLVQLEGKYRIVGGEPIVANWFTGEFELPQGELVGCDVEQGFQLKYEKVLILTFVAGVLVERVVRDVD